MTPNERTILWVYAAIIAIWPIRHVALWLIFRRIDVLTPQSPGLHAISLGLSRCFADDHEMLRHGMVMYDALYAWCQETA